MSTLSWAAKRILKEAAALQEETGDAVQKRHILERLPQLADQYQNAAQELADVDYIEEVVKLHGASVRGQSFLMFRVTATGRIAVRRGLD